MSRYDSIDRCRGASARSRARRARASAWPARPGAARQQQRPGRVLDAQPVGPLASASPPDSVGVGDSVVVGSLTSRRRARHAPLQRPHVRGGARRRGRGRPPSGPSPTPWCRCTGNRRGSSPSSRSSDPPPPLGHQGAPAVEHRPTVTLHMREPALHLVDDAPDRLIASITDAMARVPGRRRPSPPGGHHRRYPHGPLRRRRPAGLVGRWLTPDTPTPRVPGSAQSPARGGARALLSSTSAAQISWRNTATAGTAPAICAIATDRILDQLTNRPNAYATRHPPGQATVMNASADPERWPCCPPVLRRYAVELEATDERCERPTEAGDRAGYRRRLRGAMAKAQLNPGRSSGSFASTQPD